MEQGTFPVAWYGVPGTLASLKAGEVKKKGDVTPAINPVDKIKFCNFIGLKIKKELVKKLIKVFIPVLVPIHC